MIVPGVVQIMLCRPCSTSEGERGSWRDPHRDGKRELTAFDSMVESKCRSTRKVINGHASFSY